MKAQALIEFLQKYPDAQVNIPSLNEFVVSTPLLLEDLLVRTWNGKTLIFINNDRTLSDDT